MTLRWAAHHPEPFPEVPVDTKHDLAYLDFDVAGCVMTCLNNGGVPGEGRTDILRECLPELQEGACSR